MSGFEAPLDCDWAMHEGAATYGHIGGEIGATAPVLAALGEADSAVGAPLIGETLLQIPTGYEAGHDVGAAFGGLADGLACEGVNAAAYGAHAIHDYLEPLPEPASPDDGLVQSDGIYGPGFGDGSASALIDYAGQWDGAGGFGIAADTTGTGVDVGSDDAGSESGAQGAWDEGGSSSGTPWDDSGFSTETASDDSGQGASDTHADGGSDYASSGDTADAGDGSDA
jgi:hypothetical protein